MYFCSVNAYRLPLVQTFAGALFHLYAKCEVDCLSHNSARRVLPLQMPQTEQKKEKKDYMHNKPPNIHINNHLRSRKVNESSSYCKCCRCLHWSPCGLQKYALCKSAIKSPLACWLPFLQAISVHLCSLHQRAIILRTGVCFRLLDQPH